MFYTNNINKGINEPNFEEQKLTQELSNSKSIKDHKTNITGYLSIVNINKIESLAREQDRSRNNLVEEGLLDLLKKYNKL